MMDLHTTQRLKTLPRVTIRELTSMDLAEALSPNMRGLDSVICEVAQAARAASCEAEKEIIMQVNRTRWIRRRAAAMLQFSP